MTEGRFNGPEPAAPLFGADRLSPDEASRLLARGPGRLVVWAGEPRSGRTTLTVELYERQRRSATEVRFAGSWTLLAFEQLASIRRGGVTGAGNGVPLAQTTIGARELLHLALSAGADPLHVLFAELPGDVVPKLADNQLAAADVPILRRADKLALVVDGERLRDAARRPMVLTRVRQLLERLQSSSLPHPDSGLALVVTKWDRVRDEPPAIAYWEEREAELVEDMRALVPAALALRTSATDADGLTGLSRWLLDAQPDEVVQPLVIPAPPLELNALARPLANAVPLPATPDGRAARRSREDALDEPLLEVPVTGIDWRKGAPQGLRLPWRWRR